MCQVRSWIPWSLLAVLAAIAGLSAAAGATTEHREQTHLELISPFSTPTGTLNTLSPEATTMLSAIVLPPDTHQVVRLNQSALRQPAQSVGCVPLVDESRFWVARGSVSEVVSYLRAHPETGRRTAESGSLNGGQLEWVAEVPTGGPAKNQSTLVVTISSVSTAEVGIRADAQVVPLGAECVSAGGDSRAYLSG